jgi:hypothetical protein
MNPKNPSPRDELSPFLRSIIEDIANEPVPADLISSASVFRALDRRKSVTSRKGLSAVVSSLLALGLIVALLVVREKPTDPEPKLAQESQPVPKEDIQELPPPSLWAYRQVAHSPEALDELLTRHASAFLPASPDVLLHPFSRNEDL